MPFQLLWSSSHFNMIVKRFLKLNKLFNCRVRVKIPLFIALGIGKCFENQIMTKFNLQAHCSKSPFPWSNPFIGGISFTFNLTNLGSTVSTQTILRLKFKVYYRWTDGSSSPFVKHLRSCEPNIRGFGVCYLIENKCSAYPGIIS